MGKASKARRRLAGRGRRPQLLPTEPQRIDRGTPETQARLRPDPVETLYTRRRNSGRPMDRSCLDAAAEIREVYEAVTAGLWARAQRIEPRVDGERREPLTTRLTRLYHDRYLPWTERIGDALPAVIDIVWDGRTCTDVALERRCTPGRIADTVADALLAYAEIAGWVVKRAA